MIQSTIRKSEYEEIYRLLDTVSPLPFDCGSLCGAVCCGTDDEAWTEHPEISGGSSLFTDTEAVDKILDMGIYLLPGEEKIHSKNDDWLIWSEEQAEDYEFPDSWKGKVFFVRCKTPPHCPREKRPIQCRTFPLTPHFMEDGRLVMILNDLELPYRCPLIEEKIRLNRSFLEVTHECWQRLVKDPLIRDLIQMDSEERGEYGEEPVIVYDPLVTGNRSIPH